VPVDIASKLRPFQARIQAQSEQLLVSIKPTADPSAVLVVFPAGDAQPWCEPSDGIDLAGIGEELAAIRSSKRRLPAAEAETAALTAALGRDRRRTAMLSAPVAVHDHSVHVVVTVDTAALEATPRLPESAAAEHRGVRGIIEALIVTLLDRCKAELNTASPGGAEDEDLGGEELDIGLRAVRRIVKIALDIAEQPGGWQIASKIQRIVSQPYEGRWKAGRLVIVPPGDEALEVCVELTDPIPLDEHRTIRKLLEASGPDLAVLMDARSVYGLGTIAETPGVREKVFEVAVDTTGGWGLSYAGRELFRVKDSFPCLPEAPLDHLPELVDRVFGAGCDVDKLTELANAAAGNRHGAMLIISSAAAHEASRLWPQVLRTDPEILSAETLDHLTDMDGGVLVDPHGRCHAIGVILDGLATGKNGSPARGSRYNNSVRYLAGDGVPLAIVLCYSSDGDIRMLSQLGDENPGHLLD
jgi:hypothetical protein